ncbi:hypothetical protein ABZ641_37275, partial [Kitasatospora sp. NPDC007106]
RHLLLAGPEHRRPAAAEARRAGDRAAALLAFEDAAHWYRRSAEADPDTDPVELRLALGAALLGAGESAAARTAHLQAAALARTAGRPDLLARAALGLGTGPVGFEVALLDREQLALLTEARTALAAPAPGPAAPARPGERLPGGPDAGRRAVLIAEVTARLSVAAALVETDGYRAELAEEAVRLARSTGDPAALGSALAALCDARSGPDHCRARLDWAGEIVALARTADDPVLELLGRRLRLVALWETGDLAAGNAEISAFDALARVLRRPLYGWYAPLWRGARALLEGRREDCRRELAETGAVGRRAGSANAAMLAATQHWCLLAAEGDTEGLARLIEGSPPLEREPGVWPKVALALLAAQFGRTEEAARRLAAVAPALPAAPRDSEWLPMLAQAAETVGLLGAHPVARQVAGPLRAALAPYAGLFAVEGIGAGVPGPVDHHQAQLAAPAPGTV